MCSAHCPKAKRPGLNQLLADARRGRFDIVMVWDRITRCSRHFLEVLDELNHINVEFVSFRERTSTPADRLAGPSSSSSVPSPS